MHGPAVEGERGGRWRRCPRRSFRITSLRADGDVAAERRTAGGDQLGAGSDQEVGDLAAVRHRLRDGRSLDAAAVHGHDRREGEGAGGIDRHIETQQRLGGRAGLETGQQAADGTARDLALPGGHGLRQERRSCGDGEGHDDTFGRADGHVATPSRRCPRRRC